MGCEVGLNAAYTVEDTQIDYTVQIRSGDFFNESQATLSSIGGIGWDHAYSIDWDMTYIDVDGVFGPSNYSEYLDVYASRDNGVDILGFTYNTMRHSNSVIQVTLIPEAGYEDLFQVDGVPRPNDSVKIDPDTGIITFCIVGLAGV